MIDTRHRNADSGILERDVTVEQLAQMGDGSIAYVRQMASEEVQQVFPQVGPIQPGLRLFALFAADGSPILLADSRSAAIANAWEHDLETVSVH